MASDPMMIEPPSMPDSEWDEAKILSSLARLQEMHIRVYIFKIVCGRL